MICLSKINHTTSAVPYKLKLSNERNNEGTTAPLTMTVRLFKIPKIQSSYKEQVLILQAP